MLRSLRRTAASSSEIPVEDVLFPDEGHGFVRLENRTRSSVEIVRRFEVHLAGRS